MNRTDLAGLDDTIANTGAALDAYRRLADDEWHEQFRAKCRPWITAWVALSIPAFAALAAARRGPWWLASVGSLLVAASLATAALGLGWVAHVDHRHTTKARCPRLDRGSHTERQD